MIFPVLKNPVIPLHGAAGAMFILIVDIPEFRFMCHDFISPRLKADLFFCFSLRIRTPVSLVCFSHPWSGSLPSFQPSDLHLIFQKQISFSFSDFRSAGRILSADLSCSIRPRDLMYSLSGQISLQIMARRSAFARSRSVPDSFSSLHDLKTAITLALTDQPAVPRVPSGKPAVHQRQASPENRPTPAGSPEIHIEALCRSRSPFQGGRPGRLL